MSDTVIKVENLSKKYVIRHEQRERYTALRDVMSRGVKNFGKKLLLPFTRNESQSTASKEDFYALRDVSFEVKQGDRVGIIGRNGAGKSTLLKILSRITEPTTGRIEIEGRVASLLEVGTGFHPELTGRENIFLNGAILGMTRAEIKKKFDEIVDFAEIEKFLDTPVKRYSSGMYVRLAFAVAAHLEPEILIVDEVLAVGDAQFQKKCLGKMEEVSRTGRAILFVSHSMAAIQSLTSSVLLIERGQLKFNGSTEDGISIYLQRSAQLSEIRISERVDRYGTQLLKFVGISIESADGVVLTEIRSGLTICIKLAYKAEANLSNVIMRIKFIDQHGRLLFICNNYHSSPTLFNLDKGEGFVKCIIQRFPLHEGEYSIDLHALINYEVADEIEAAFKVKVSEGDFFGTGKLPAIREGILVEHKWAL